MEKTKISFVIRNSVKALLWLGAFVALYIVFKKYVKIDYLNRLEPFFDNEPLIYLIFISSEIVVGIIPPELFIIWALRDDILFNFLIRVASLSVISYVAGVIGYFIGVYLSRTVFFNLMKKRFLKNLEKRLEVFGIYLILIASLTPIPFSGTAMLVGFSRYSFKKFILFSLARFLRFALYAFVFWKVDPSI
jgi:membrane protein YqaA with SNARE-associated domain